MEARQVTWTGRADGKTPVAARGLSVAVLLPRVAKAFGRLPA